MLDEWINLARCLDAMKKETGYGRFCPVAKAAEIVTARWTPLILRELISGSCRFNEIHRGVPLMSRALLSRRLKQLQSAGIIERVMSSGFGTPQYRLTASGEELRPIIIALGVWGQHWVESALDSNDWDAGVLMWDMRRRIDLSALPKTRTVVQFEFTDAPDELGLWWIVAESGSVDLCQSDPGFDVDLYVSTTVRAIGNVWIGKKSLRRAMDDNEIAAFGDARLRSTLGNWLQLSALVEATPKARRSAL